MKRLSILFIAGLTLAFTACQPYIRQVNSTDIEVISKRRAYPEAQYFYYEVRNKIGERSYGTLTLVSDQSWDIGDTLVIRRSDEKK